MNKKIFPKYFINILKQVVDNAVNYRFISFMLRYEKQYMRCV
jgi:hypothetical protein